jgi:hypothetical protein
VLLIILLSGVLAWTLSQHPPIYRDSRCISTHTTREGTHTSAVTGSYIATSCKISFILGCPFEVAALDLGVRRANGNLPIRKLVNNKRNTPTYYFASGCDGTLSRQMSATVATHKGKRIVSTLGSSGDVRGPPLFNGNNVTAESIVDDTEEESGRSSHESTYSDEVADIMPDAPGPFGSRIGNSFGNSGNFRAAPRSGISTYTDRTTVNELPNSRPTSNLSLLSQGSTCSAEVADIMCVHVVSGFLYSRVLQLARWHVLSHGMNSFIPSTF